MAFSLWFALRQAREALRGGQPELARRVLEPFVRDGYRKAIVEYGRVSKVYRDRAEAGLRAGNSEAAWNDLQSAESLSSGNPDAAKLRTELTTLGLTSARAALLNGNPLATLDAIDRLKHRAVFHADFEWIAAAAHLWAQAIETSDRGEFPAAITAVERARARLPAEMANGIERFCEQLESRFTRYREVVEALHTASTAANWGEVVRRADEVLRLAPDHREARTLRAHAWEARIPGVTMAESTLHAPHEARGLPAEREEHSGVTPKRFLLWIDGVGGYLVCLAPRVTFGQATTHGPIDIPLYADVSRLHAEITRDSEGYILESTRVVSVNGQSTTRTTLKPGDRVTLGATCQFQFALPVPISPTARLDLVSGHRLPLAVDGVLLMADNLIIGPGAQVHVPMPDADSNVILYRSKEGLGLRFVGPFRVDNQPYTDRAPLPIPCQVTADSFSFAIEAVGPRV